MEDPNRAIMRGLIELLQPLTNSDLQQTIVNCEMIIIRRRAEQDGKNAAGWLIDGNTTDPLSVLKRWLKGIDDGDPAILDELPSPRLGGEFADDPTWEDVLRAELGRFDGSDGYEDLYEEYNQHFHSAVEEHLRYLFHYYS